MLLFLDRRLLCPINEASEIDLFSSYDFRSLPFRTSDLSHFPFKLTCTNLCVKVTIYFQFCPKYSQYAPPPLLYP